MEGLRSIVECCGLWVCSLADVDSGIGMQAHCEMSPERAFWQSTENSARAFGVIYVLPASQVDKTIAAR